MQAYGQRQAGVKALDWPLVSVSTADQYMLFRDPDHHNKNPRWTEVDNLVVSPQGRVALAWRHNMRRKGVGWHLPAALYTLVLPMRVCAMMRA